ncbi:MAG: ORF6N domain-containing protein [Sulfuritalea sp.]|nr:ORF6N domain-containing protein [Sulfuritalea sp.]
MTKSLPKPENLAQLVFLIRGEKVLLDADLAMLYGVETGALNRAVKRNIERIETVGDDGDLQEVYDTERQLLYVACTRARDRLLVTGTKPASEFLDDLAE